MLQRDTHRPAALHKLDRCGVASLAIGVVVGDREDDRGNPYQRRPVGVGKADGKSGREAGPDDDKGTVEEAESVDVDSVRSKTPAGWWHRLAFDALEEYAAYEFLVRC
jgi:hypothetical protein